MKNSEIFKDIENTESDSNILKYVVNLIFVIIISLVIIWKYYETLHNEIGNYSSYILSVSIIYLIYKSIKTYISKDKVIFSPVWIIGYTLINISILSGIFFSLQWNSIQNWSMILVFKIIGFSFLPFFITTINYSFGKKILSYIKSFNSEENTFKFLMSLWFWLTCFLTLVLISGVVWQYNIYAVSIILIAFLWFAFKEFINSIISLWTYKIEFDNHKLDWNVWQAINLNLLSAELAFMVLTFLIGINFINIVRPMPIGWDDLGSYMNFPQIMANAWTISKWIWFMSWQLFTGIWYMFHSAPQAFFINQIWWILSIIVLVVVISDLLKTSNKKHLSIPIIIATIFYAMPMVIFEQAKDMKLDPGLFFVSVIWIYLTYKLSLRYLWYFQEKISTWWETIIEKTKSWFQVLISKYQSVFKSESWEKNLFNNKDYLIYVFIIWTIVWLAFAIKFTTLMLIIWLIWVLFYIKLGLSGFMGYFVLFVWIFTKFRLWDMMNINYPKDNISWINNFSYLLIFISLLIFVYSYFKYQKESFIRAFTLVIIFCLWIITPLIPWMIKNVWEVGVSWINITWILNWKPNMFTPDFSKIYSKTELDKINNVAQFWTMDSSWKTNNEDMWRYFWYENWVNNYLKLPWNLTMQSNQGWEYTEITYIFLALIPIILVFLAYKNYLFAWILILATLFWWMYFNSKYSTSLTDFFSKQTLPFGYIYIVWSFFLPLVFFLYSLKNDKLSQIFKINSVFFASYTLLFVVAAYWIVWYWIAMYFSLLLMIAIGLSYISEESKNQTYNGIKLFWSAILLIIISIYFFKSSLPHGINNIAQAWFPEFKAWTVNQEEWIFRSHPDYFEILANLNITDKDKLVSESLATLDNEGQLKKLINANLWAKPAISTLESFLRELTFADLSKYKIDANTALILKSDARPLLNTIYNAVLYPSKELQNNDKIYRIGTFLTYFISNNRTRYYDDSLVTNFWQYFYDKNPDVAVERMKKVWLKYLLTDLNAATIDKDPRHNLTVRYENLLRTFKSDKLELIQTDSICLRIALDEKDDNFMSYAWVNSESYGSWWQVISRSEKMLWCYNHILDLMQKNKIDNTHYSYLMPIVNLFKQNPPKDQKEMLNIFQQYITHWWLALFRIK